jgi:hypothetical protein
LGHSPAKVLTPYHELIARLIAKEHTHCEFLGHEPSNIVVPLSKDQQHWLWQFSDLWKSSLANFPGQIREDLLHSKLLQFASLHTFVFPKIILSSPLLEAVTIFTDALGVVLLPITPKIAIRLNILFLPHLKGQNCMLSSWSSGTLHNNLSIYTVTVTM